MNERDERGHGERGHVDMPALGAPYIDEMEPRQIPDPEAHRMRPLILIALLAVLGLVSVFPLRAHFSTPETYADIIATLDAKRDTVLGLTAASAGVSAAISAIPGDAGTPIAEKLMDLSADFMIVLAAIYLEKFLLTTLGFASFGILFPVACAFAAVAVAAVAYGKGGWRRAAGALLPLAAKVVVLGVVLAATVPASVFITNAIEGTYEQSIQNTIDAANEAADEADEAKESDGDDILSWLQGAAGAVAEGVGAIAGGVQNLVNRFIDALAIMIVTSCVIPILVLLFLLWAAKLVLGVNIDVPLALLKPRVMRTGQRGGRIAGPRG